MGRTCSQMSRTDGDARRWSFDPLANFIVLVVRSPQRSVFAC